MNKDQTYKEAEVSQHVARWFKVVLLNFLIAASIGVLLRYAFVREVKWLDYKAFQNAHSHLALFGWGFLAFFVLLINAFVPPENHAKKKFNSLFVIAEIVILAIVISFIFFENKLVAYVFVAVFSFVAFSYVYLFLIESGRQHRQKISFKFARVALIFLCLSFLGTYVLIPSLMVSGTKKILLYYLSSQFFLHFQYNAWFIFAAFALFFRLVEEKGIQLDGRKNKQILYGLFTGVILTFFISIFWGNQTRLLYLWIASVGGLLQLLVFVFHWRYLVRIVKELNPKITKGLRMLLMIAIACLLLKILMQVIVIVPFIAALAFTIRNYVIAYIHLIFIGFVSIAVFGWAIEHRLISVAGSVKHGVIMLVVGFVVIELFLFIQGTLLWLGKGFISFYYPVLFLASVLLPVGLLIIAIKNYKYLPFKNNV